VRGPRAINRYSTQSRMPLFRRNLYFRVCEYFSDIGFHVTGFPAILPRPNCRPNCKRPLQQKKVKVRAVCSALTSSFSGQSSLV
jgi:hypothetical protein